jgi:hypothetical protein
MRAANQLQRLRVISPEALKVFIERWVLAPFIAASMTMMLVLMMSLEAATV